MQGCSVLPKKEDKDMKEVKLVNAEITKLDPSKKYIISVDIRDMTREECVRLTYEVSEMGIANVVVCHRDGGRLEVIEASEYKKEEIV